MPSVQINVYVKDEEYTNFLLNKSRIQEEVKQLVKEIVKVEEDE